MKIILHTRMHDYGQMVEGVTVELDAAAPALKPEDFSCTGCFGDLSAVQPISGVKTVECDGNSVHLATDPFLCVETTLAAVSQAVELLAPGGVLTICVYPGHEEGAREREALLTWAAALPGTLDVLHQRYMNQKNSPPELLAVRRRP